MGGSSNDNQAVSGRGGTGMVRAIVEELRAKAAKGDEPPVAVQENAAVTDALGRLRGRLVRISDLRSRRRDLFGSDLFADPAWDILLSLFESSLAGRGDSVSSACMAADVPQSTALRWLNVLESRGWVERRSDPQDRRRVHVRLTDKCFSALVELFGDKSA